MIDTAQFDQRIEELEQELRTKLGVRGDSLAQRLKRAGHRLPRRLQKAGRVIVRARDNADHPKIARMQNHGAVDAAFADLTEHLDSIDAADQRKGFILGIVGDLVFRLILLTVAVIVILRWQGMI